MRSLSEHEVVCIWKNLMREYYMLLDDPELFQGALNNPSYGTESMSLRVTVDKIKMMFFC